MLRIWHYKKILFLIKTADEKWTTCKEIAACRQKYLVTAGKDDSIGTERNYEKSIFYQMAKYVANCQELEHSRKTIKKAIANPSVPQYRLSTGPPSLGDGSISGYNQNVA